MVRNAWNFGTIYTGHKLVRLELADQLLTQVEALATERFGIGHLVMIKIGNSLRLAIL